MTSQIFKKIGINIFLIAVFLFPLFTNAALVPCDGIAVPCNFEKLMELIDTFIKFLLFALAMPLAALAFSYAGFLYLTSGVVDNKKKAKSIFWNVFIGLVIALAAWIIVHFVLTSLGYNTSLFPSFYKK